MNKQIEVTENEIEENFKELKKKGKKKSTIKEILNITEYQYNKLNRALKEEGQTEVK